MQKSKRFMSLVLTVMLCLGIFAGSLQLKAKAASYRTGYVNDPVDSCLRIRDAAGTSGNIIGYLDHGTPLKIYSETTVSGVLWYQVSCVQSGVTLNGYVSSQYVTLAEEDESFDDYLAHQGFPESYRDALRIIHSLYPNWVFQAVHTNIDWNTAVAKESEIGRSLVPRSWDKAYINTADVDSSGKQIGRDGANWVSASSKAVAYYMDPRNALTTPYIFQFECLSYNSDVHNAAGVQKILKGSFMENGYNVGATSYTYAETFMKAAEISKVSPYHLASRVLQEQGYTGTWLSDGEVPGYPGAYNFFNVGAYTTDNASASVNGAIYAQKVSSAYYGPWTSPYNSIIGGSIMLGENYINDGQDTLYFQRFNVVVPQLFGHQYMTNVAAPRSESSSMMSAYSGDVLSGSLVFRIPVYTNMPDKAVPLPTDASAGDEPSSGVQPTYSSSVYSVTDGLISKVSTNIKVSDFLKNFSVKDGTISLVNSLGTVKTVGTVGTGDVLQIKSGQGNVVYKSIPIAVAGDVNGDGQTALVDYLLIKKSLLKTAAFSKAQIAGADINKNGKVDLADFLLVKKTILGTYKITP